MKNDPRAGKKIWVIRNLQGGHVGHIVADSEEEARLTAARLYSRLPEQLVIVDTGRTQPRCCGSR